MAPLIYKVYLMKIDHLNFEIVDIFGIVQVLRFDFRKFRIWEILNLHSCSASCELGTSDPSIPIEAFL